MKKLSRILITILLIISAVALYLFWKNNAGENPPAEDVPTSSVEKPVNEEESPFESIHFEVLTDMTKDYTLAIHSPTIDSAYVNQEVQSWLSQVRKDFITQAEENSREDISSNLTVVVEVTDLSNEVYHLLFKGERTIAGDKAHNFYKTFTFNIPEDRFLTLDEFIETDKVHVNTLKDFTFNKLEENKDLTGQINEKELDTQFNNINELKWQVDGKQLTLYFDQASIAPKEAGAIEVRFTLDQLSAFTKKQAEEVAVEKETEVNLNDRDPDEEEPDVVNIVPEEPAEQPPATQPPATQPPATQPPATQPPATQPPATQPPATQPPATQPPATQPPATQPPATQPPATQPPATQPPVANKVIALTFDDGPSGTVTPRVLNTLSQYGIPATFYVLGVQTQTYPGIVARIANEGHELGNHSYTHQKLTLASANTIYNEIYSTTQAIINASGSAPITFRPPYGAYNQTVLNQSNALGLPLVTWTIDTLDWQSRNPQAILQEVKNQAHDGGIVLMHDIHPTTADALPAVIEYLQSQGYRFVTMSQLLY